MKVYPDKIVRQAQGLRRKNFSYREIGKILSVPNCTIRKWCFNVEGGKGSSLKLVERNKQIRKNFLDEGKKIIKKLNINNISRDQARLLASILYWCEGTKYPLESRVSFVNSNEQMMKTFIMLLRKGFNLHEKKFRVHLQIHNTHNFKKLRKYWSNILDILESQFVKPTITEPTGNRHRHRYKGTCSLRYNDYQVLLKLIAIYENFALAFNKI